MSLLYPIKHLKLWHLNYYPNKPLKDICLNQEVYCCFYVKMAWPLSYYFQLNGNLLAFKLRQMIKCIKNKT